MHGTWHEAHAACLAEGGVLACARDASEFWSVRQAILAAGFDESSSVWIGLNDVGLEVGASEHGWQWAWAVGSPLAEEGVTFWDPRPGSLPLRPSLITDAHAEGRDCVFARICPSTGQVSDCTYWGTSNGAEDFTRPLGYWYAVGCNARLEGYVCQATQWSPPSASPDLDILEGDYKLSLIHI